ncbi:hypothetical protein Tco_0954699 [Tanacetum coccineum]|uniref:Uncharacterized protein n=1 Tax=Tanacetum coccineum TaxID=301880 RepID=A0ABQ5E558_9ASTR
MPYNKLHLCHSTLPSTSVVSPTPPTTQPIPSEATTIPSLSQPASPTPSPAHEPMRDISLNNHPLTNKPPTTRSRSTTSYFGAMLTDISRDDLTELYRIVMRKHGMNKPEDELEKFKVMLDKKLQGGKPDEDCYKLLKMMEKQAGIRKHKDWLVQEQTTLGKDFSNPLMADNLPKIVWLSTHHIWQSPYHKPSAHWKFTFFMWPKIETNPEQTGLLVEFISNPIMAINVFPKTNGIQHNNVSCTESLNGFHSTTMDMHLSGGQRTDYSRVNG